MKTAYYIQNKKEGKFIFKYLKINGKPFGTGYIIKTKNVYTWSLDCPDDCDDTISVKFLMSLDNQKLEKRISKLESKVEGLMNPVKKKVIPFPIPELINELNELPEKWCVKVSEDNSELILTWFEKKLGRDIYGPFGYAHYPEFERQVCTSGEIKEGYTEISFSDFERLVLKKEEVKDYPIIGNWYKTPSLGKAIFCVTNYNKHTKSISAYGINYKGEWIYNDACFTIYDSKLDSPSTNQEVEEALKNEAIKRGFKNTDIIVYEPESNRLVRHIIDFGIEEIFSNGIWAEIVQDNHDDVYAKGVWDKFLTKEIDWSIPGQIVRGEYTTAITTGKHNNSFFEGFVIKVTDKSDVNYLCKTFIKKYFSLAKEEIILKN